MSHSHFIVAYHHLNAKGAGGESRHDLITLLWSGVSVKKTELSVRHLHSFVTTSLCAKNKSVFLFGVLPLRSPMCIYDFLLHSCREEKGAWRPCVYEQKILVNYFVMEVRNTVEIPGVSGIQLGITGKWIFLGDCLVLSFTRFKAKGKTPFHLFTKSKLEWSLKSTKTDDVIFFISFSKKIIFTF